MYAVFEDLCKKNNVRPSDVSRATGISTATLTSWKQGKYTPKQDKLQKIADFFNVSLDFLMNGKEAESYYLNPETASAAQEIFDNPDLRALFDAGRDAKPEDLRMAAELLTRLKETNRDG